MGTDIQAAEMHDRLAAQRAETARLREQLAACVTARDEANTAWAKKCERLEEVLNKAKWALVHECGGRFSPSVTAILEFNTDDRATR